MNRRVFSGCGSLGPPTCCREPMPPKIQPANFIADVAIIGGGRRRRRCRPGRGARGSPRDFERRNGLDRRPAHPASRPPRRTSLDRVVRLYGLLSPLPQRRPRLLSSSLPAHDRGHGPRVFESRQWLGFEAVPRARVALAVLESMLAPFVSSGRIRVLRLHKAVKATANRDHLRAVTLQPPDGAPTVENHRFLFSRCHRAR